jgi:hypothetical protein
MGEAWRNTRGPKPGEGGRPPRSRFGSTVRVSVPERLREPVLALVAYLEGLPGWEPESDKVQFHAYRPQVKVQNKSSIRRNAGIKKHKGFTGERPQGRKPKI